MKKGEQILGKSYFLAVLAALVTISIPSMAQPRGNGNRDGGRGRNFSNNSPRQVIDNDRPRRIENNDRPRQIVNNDRPRRIGNDDRRSWQIGNNDRSRRIENDDRPRQIVNNRTYLSNRRVAMRPAYNRGGIGYYNNSSRVYAYNRPMQILRPRGGRNINIGFGVGLRYRYNPRFYYGGAYHYQPYYYRPFIAPRFGIRLNILPFGCYSFYLNSLPYHYYNGLYYRQYNGYYETVEPPLGAKLPSLPSGAEAVLIDGQQYYECNGTYYQRGYNENGNVLYEVVGTNGMLDTDRQVQNQLNQDVQPGNGDVFYQLPEGTKEVTIDDRPYFLSPGGDYYEQFIGENNKIYYLKADTQITTE